MPSDWVFIALGLMSIATVWLINGSSFRTWAKKQNFSLKIRAENIKLKQLERQLNIKSPNETKGLLENLKGLDLNKINDLIGMVQRRDDLDEDEAPSIENTLIDIAQNNPELVQKVLGNLGGSGSDHGGYLGE